MAEPISIQQLRDASLDVKSLEEVVNGDENVVVTTRLGETYPSVKGSIKTLFENGGLPATPFATKALMTASALVDGEYAMVTNDTANNGLYIKTAGVWVKSAYDPTALANTYTDNKVKSVTNNFKTKALVVASALPDGSYAMVTEDTEANNGLYVKTAGTWVKSAYDPVGISNSKFDELYGANNNYISVRNYEDAGIYIAEQVGTSGNYTRLKIPSFALARAGQSGSTVLTWDRVISDIADPSLFVTSDGVTDCLELISQAFIYDLKEAKFKVIARHLTQVNRHVVIASTSYGSIVSGSLRDIRTEHLIDVAQKDVIKNTNRIEFLEAIATPLKEVEFEVGSVTSADGSDVDSYSHVARTGFLKVTNNSYIVLPEGYVGIVFKYDKSRTYIKGGSLWRPDLSTYFNPSHDFLYRITVKKDGTGTSDTIDLSFVKSNVVLSPDIQELDLGGDSAVKNPSHQPRPQTKFMAHGGLSALHKFAPFNSSAACVLAGQYGYYGVEIDFVETLDKEWVCIHDETVDAYTYSTGNVKDYTLAELKAMDASKLSAAHGWSNVSLMSLDEALEICVTYNLRPILQYKMNADAAAINKMVNTVRKYMPISQCAISTGRKPIISLTRELHPDVPLWFATTSALTTSDIKFALSLGNCGVSPQFTVTSKDKIDEAHAAGIEVMLWSLTQKDVDQGRALGADYLLSDGALPHSFDKGVITASYNSGIDFSGITSIGTGVVDADRFITVDSGVIYHEIDVNRGDVVSATCEASHTGSGALPIFKIDGYNAAGSKVIEYTAMDIDSTSPKSFSVIALSYSINVTKVRVSITASTGVKIRDLKIRKREI